MTRYADLIAKLEQCEGPDRHLDSLIWAEVDDRDVITHTDGRLMARSRRPPHDTCLLHPEMHKPPLPKFTESLDAALTLVPEGWAFHRLHQYFNNRNPAWGYGGELRCFAQPDIGLAVGESRNSPALALCIAALKARTVEESNT